MYVCSFNVRPMSIILGIQVARKCHEIYVMKYVMKNVMKNGCVKLRKKVS